MPQFVEDVEAIRRRAEEKIEEGAVTSSYKGDVEQTVSILNEALATEIVCVLRYMHHYFMATGVHGQSVADEFKEHADAEREHADKIAERIQQLGGKPDFNPKSLLQRSVSQYVEGETLADMIREDLIAERIVIEVYQKMVRHFGNNDPTTRHMVEEILADEEEHASDLSDMLYIVDPQTGETEGRDPGTTPLEEEGGRRGGSGRQRAHEVEPRERASAGERRPRSGTAKEADETLRHLAEIQQGGRQERGAEARGREQQEQFAGRGSAGRGERNEREAPRRQQGRGERQQPGRDRGGRKGRVA